MTGKRHGSGRLVGVVSEYLEILYRVIRRFRDFQKLAWSAIGADAPTMFDVMNLWPLSYFQPKWKKEGYHLLKGAKKFIHYKRDLLKQDRIDEIESRRADLRAAIGSGEKGAVEEAGKQLRATCEQSLGSRFKQSWWEENVEVIFVALVVALGLRTYVVQPFRIPTGSMQPTLNGIVIEHEGEDYEKPWIGKQAWDLVFTGKSHKNIIADKDKKVERFRDASWFLFTRTEVSFDDGSKIKLPAAMGEVQRLMMNPEATNADDAPRFFRKGDPILRGTITTGDLVLVDRISYHFRKPKRGEVFVFDTRALHTSGDTSPRLAGQSGGSHYIKRLCGVPGDTLQIETPNLLVNGRITSEPGIQRVMKREGEYGGPDRPGYTLVRQVMDRNTSRPSYRRQPLMYGSPPWTLKDSEKPGMREYAAIGDNTANSLDSRYWGSVKEFNLVGPGWVSLWPFGSGHWGFIR